MSITLTLAIDNVYDGHLTIATTAEVVAPLPPPEGERGDWEEDYIFPETGAGRAPAARSLA